MDEFSKIINWENIFSKSEDFQNKNPTKFTFLEDIFFEDFYKKLYETFPKIETFTKIETGDKTAFRRWWGKNGKDGVLDPNEEDKELSPEWNLFYKYLQSNEFIEKIQKFSKINVNKTKHFAFLNMQRGGYQLPHTHDVGPRTLILIIYFNKNWPDGESGGTYISKDDGAEIIFEPYNLENSCIVFQDGPYAEHGVRYLERDTERKGIQITVEGFSTKNGWSCYENKIKKIEL